jgi:HSP20 family protein
MYRNLFARDLMAEFDRLQRDVGSLFDHSPSIRGFGRGGCPALNVGSTPAGLEVFAFAPGVDPASVEVHLDRGVLTIAGERKSAIPAAGDSAEGKLNLHLNERFVGRFRRVVNLPDDIDPASVGASYRDGVLRVTAARKAAAQPRRIEVN